MDPNPDSLDEWIEPWMSLWANKITRYAFVLVCDQDLAQDVAQETFMKLLLFHRRYPRRSVTVGWLFKVARHLAFDTLRRHRRHPRSDNGKIDGDDTTNVNQSDSHVWMPILFRDLLERLPADDRECLWLFYYADWSTEQIARHLHIPPGTVRARLLRSRRRLKILWEVDEHERPIHR